MDGSRAALGHLRMGRIQSSTAGSGRFEWGLAFECHYPKAITEQRGLDLGLYDVFLTSVIHFNVILPCTPTP
jgi:hypothetical protein